MRTGSMVASIAANVAACVVVQYVCVCVCVCVCACGKLKSKLWQHRSQEMNTISQRKGTCNFPAASDTQLRSIVVHAPMGQHQRPYTRTRDPTQELVFEQLKYLSIVVWIFIGFFFTGK